MKKRYFLIAFIVLGLVGSYINFYGTNLVMNAVANKGTTHFLAGILTPLPMFLMAVEFVGAFIFFVRLKYFPTHKKKLMFRYSVILMSISFVGIITTILSGVLNYGSLIKPYPFVGYHIWMLLWHIAIIAFGFVIISVLRKRVKEDDILVHRVTVKFVFQTILKCLIIFYAFNRLGAFIWMPVYVQWSSIVITYPFYLLLPALALYVAQNLLYLFNVYRKNTTVGIFVGGILTGLSLILVCMIVYRNSTDQNYLKYISPAVPLERLMVFIYDTLLISASVVIMSVLTLIKAISYHNYCKKVPLKIHISNSQKTIENN